MLTAVMAMFQIAIGLTQQQIISKPPQDLYLQSKLQPTNDWPSNDRDFLGLIAAIDTDWGTGSTLCDKIIEAKSNFSTLSGYVKSNESSSAHSRLTGACALANGGHRVLIAPAPSGETGYRLYSCVLKKRVREVGVECDFEKSYSGIQE